MLFGLLLRVCRNENTGPGLVMSHFFIGVHLLVSLAESIETLY
jgi:hypothetical protein